MLEKSINLIAVFITLSIINCQVLIAQNSWEAWSNSLEVDTIGATNLSGDNFKNTTLTVKDGKFGTSEWEKISSITAVENRLKVEATNAFRNYSIADGEYPLDLKVEFWQADNDPNGPPCAECTKIENTKIIIRDGFILSRFYRQYQDAHKMRVTVLNNLDLSKAPTIRIDLEVYVKRFYK